MQGTLVVLSCLVAAAMAGCTGYDCPYGNDGPFARFNGVNADRGVGLGQKGFGDEGLVGYGVAGYGRASGLNNGLNKDIGKQDPLTLGAGRFADKPAGLGIFPTGLQVSAFGKYGLAGGIFEMKKNIVPSNLQGPFQRPVGAPEQDTFSRKSGGYSGVNDPPVGLATHFAISGAPATFGAEGPYVKIDARNL